MNDWETSLRQERYYQHHRQHQPQPQPQPGSKTPSFSSSLLDSIYRSIDESKYEETKRKQRSTSTERNAAVLQDEKSLRKALAFEKLMERDENHRSHDTAHRGFCRSAYNSASSSSDSSCGGVFSSSETESVRPKSVSFTIQRPKQGIRSDHYSVTASEFEDTPKREARLLMRTKSKALKIYGDLKKVKQPISPGRRITSFLNSLFNSRNIMKNPKPTEGLNSLRRSRSVKDHHHHHQTTTTCSSLSSSFSRSSCLNNKLPPASSSSTGSAKCTTTTTSSNNNCPKRSVRFCLVDEDPGPRRCGKKCGYKEHPRIMPTPIVRKIAEITVIEKEANKKKNVNECGLRGFEEEEDLDDEEYDDGMSCTSSDLFELENINGAAEELPVYGTTSLTKNHAIVKGLVL